MAFFSSSCRNALDVRKFVQCDPRICARKKCQAKKEHRLRFLWNIRTQIERRKKKSEYWNRMRILHKYPLFAFLFFHQQCILAIVAVLVIGYSSIVPKIGDFPILLLFTAPFLFLPISFFSQFVPFRFAFIVYGDIIYCQSFHLRFIFNAKMPGTDKRECADFRCAAECRCYDCFLVRFYCPYLIR